MALKNVIQIGATGNLGPAVLEALIASGKFNVTVGTRDASSSSFPTGVKVIQIDYSSQKSLVGAFNGQDAVVVTIGNDNPALLEQIQMAVVDAAVTAGVSHIIPSNFGGDTASHCNPFGEFKLRVEEHLEKLSSEGKISYTPIATGGFFDWSLMTGLFGVDLANKKAVLFNDGNLKLNVTNLSSIAETIITALSEPHLVKNRLALIHDMFISQNDVVKVAEEELEAGLAAGDLEAIFGLLKAAAWGPDSPIAWGVDDDSEVLGLAPKDLREEVVKVMAQMKLRA